MGKITIEVPWDIGEYEALDAIASLALKKRNKVYGEWLKRLAEIVKRTVNPRKGEWQKWWTIATKTFELLYRGWSERSAINYVAPLAREMGVTGYERLVREIARNMDYILGVHSGEETGVRGGR